MLPFLSLVHFVSVVSYTLALYPPFKFEREPLKWARQHVEQLSSRAESDYSLSEFVVPSWRKSYNKAVKFVASLSSAELVNMTTGSSTQSPCMGNTGEITSKLFPGICLHDGPLGIRFTDNVSVFPAGITTASTFDPSLILSRAKALGAEFRGKGINVALAPAMDVLRAPASGRVFESFGGDPYLQGAAARLTVEGIQSQGVVACAKHFLANNQELYRKDASSNVDDRTSREIYGWPFEESVNAGVGSVMCSYNRINQTYACENPELLNKYLKKELSFPGFVVSDWAAVMSGAPTALAGADMNMPGFFKYGERNEFNPATSVRSFWGSNLLKMMNNGSVPIERVKDMVTRTMTSYYQMAQDNNFPATNFHHRYLNQRVVKGTVVNQFVNVQADHKTLIRRIAAAGTVVLKNSGILPLATSYASWGIIGSDAGTTPGGPNACEDRGCNTGTLAQGWGSGTAEYPYLVTPEEAIKSYVLAKNPQAQFMTMLKDNAYAYLRAEVGKLDICLVHINADSGEGYITVEGHEGDRNDLDPWHRGTILVQTVANRCPNTIVIIHTVGPLDVEGFADHQNVKAIINAGIPGQESGNSLADVLFGKVNPSGRLPYTIARKRSDYPADVLYSSSAKIPQINYNEKLLVDYRWFDKKKIVPRYEFGFGLSYTTFAFSNLQIKLLELPRAITYEAGLGGSSSLYENVVIVSFRLQNTGAIKGYEVPQLYLSFPTGSGEPPQVLRGFTRTPLDAGKSRTISFSLRRKDLAIWDVPQQQWVVPAGQFKVAVGQSSRRLPLQGSFKL